jgi:hypothetical protein
LSIFKPQRKIQNDKEYTLCFGQVIQVYWKIIIVF